VTTNTTLPPQPTAFAQDNGMNQQPPSPRCMMWVDGVGGYLMCLSETVRVGQAVAGTHVEIPVMGDLSRLHVTIERQGEVYLIRPHGPTWVGHRAVTEPRLLTDGDEVRLGASCLLRFRQPHPLSATARLDFLSHHRTQPSCDGVLLMASSCILGPSLRNHVVGRRWPHDVVLVRQGQMLTCHTGQPFEVDGVPHEGRGAITLNSRIQGEEFCLSLERID
jgi:hypothetical protein